MGLSDLIGAEVLVEAPIDVVWRTVTEPEQICRWFAERVELDLRAGGSGLFVLHSDGSGQDFDVPLVVEVVEPPVRFAFRWGPPDASLLVEFTLVAETPERTRLRVAEHGLDHTAWGDDEKQRYADDHRNGWARHTGRLADLLARPAE